MIGHSVASEDATANGVALVGALPTMIVWAWVLYRVQLVRSRLLGDPQYQGTRSGWRRSLSAERERSGTLLERSLVLSAMLAIIALALWLIFGPPAPWPSWNPLAR
jgi:hypothetical protein